MNKNILLLGCALLMCSQLSYAGLVIEGGINGNTGSGGTSVDVSINGSTNGNNGTGVNIGGQNGAQKPGSAASQLQKDIYASICASPFMKKYASICQ
ncbi:Uncharacterised protein [Serratia entomophila]|uniref:hypothetical protein n=1 Tax=Serratia entomophila TaxID=42906 RepID=UPI001F31E698|nr:hypothetical protein [Serratia entomophila]CAI0819074.1 Uncharacterised protein [Serratia entomophila]CAI0835927.1 Uncharacterised protein [Serratia entomophila]CAI0837501.1 Uncharacterised protein [Serratia entomophila]CAI0879982.1 Uncharacterised protein [Serratia entomophila]CAI0882040.1 Uncharacterised protein [Serratia entomophila]